MATNCVPEVGPFRAGIGPARFGMGPLQTVWVGPLGSVITRTVKVRNTSKAWESENPSLVFLTLDGRPPRTAVHTSGQWQPLTWTQVGSIIEAAVAQTPDCAPGARELLSTIDIFGR